MKYTTVRLRLTMKNECIPRIFGRTTDASAAETGPKMGGGGAENEDQVFVMRKKISLACAIVIWLGRTRGGQPKMVRWH